MKSYALAITLSATGTALAIAESVERVSIWTPEMIAAMFLGATGLLTAIGNMIFTHRANKTQQALVTTVTGVHEAVNGANTTLVETIARFSERIADITKDPADRIIADAAEAAAASKRAIVANGIRASLLEEEKK